MAQYSLSQSTIFTLGTEDATYIMDLVEARGLLAASGSDGVVKLYSQQELVLRNKLTGHNGPVNQSVFLPTTTHVLASASSDGSVICWDVNSGARVCTFRGKGSTTQYFCLAVNSTETLIAAGSEFHVTVWDLARKTKQSIRHFENAHTDVVTQMIFHPQDPNVLITGSADGLVSFYNISIQDEDEALVKVINIENSVAKMGIFGPNCEFLYVTTSVETFSIWNIQSESRILNLENPREELSRVFSQPVNYIIDCHYARSSGQLFLLCGSVEGVLMIARVEANQFYVCQVIHGGHTDVIRCFVWNFDNGYLATGGEDSRLCVWSTSGATASPSSSRSSSKLTPTETAPKGKSKQFTPY